MTFWDSLGKLTADSVVVIDRPKDSAHPRYADYIYPFDYGYLEGTSSGDGEGIDCWIGSLGNNTITGVIVVVDLVKKDSEIKVLLGCTESDAQKILLCHKRGSMNALLMMK